MNNFILSFVYYQINKLPIAKKYTISLVSFYDRSIIIVSYRLQMGKITVQFEKWQQEYLSFIKPHQLALNMQKIALP